MNYKETLTYLFKQLPMYQRKGRSAFKKDLKNIKSLCKYFDNPQHEFDSIHIAGTNGKGTVAHILAAVYQSAGLKVGLYTSPHYRDFRERIKINGEYISKLKVTSFTKKVIDQVDQIKPSFFEITVAMAFDHFRNEEVDIAIIETGLGGRLDSTNIITPKLSIITNISFDHQSMLGNTLKKIAKEKAGIIKKGIPIVIGKNQKETDSVFRKTAKRKSSKIYFAKNLIKTKNKPTKSSQLKNPYLSENIRTAKAAIEVWNNHKLGKKITMKIKDKAIANFRVISNYKGRWQILSNDPLVIADSAHNEGGLSLLLKEISKKYDECQIHFVLGFVKDKELSPLLQKFPKGASYYFCNAQIPRALPSKDLKSLAEEQELYGKSYKTVRSALQAAKRRATKADIIVICGSIFVVSEIIP